MTRRCDRIRLAASASFTAAEVEALDALLRGLLRGGDVKLLARRAEIHAIARKTLALRKRIELQKKVRAELAGEMGYYDEDRWAKKE